MIPKQIIHSYIPPEYQDIIIKGFNQFDREITYIVDSEVSEEAPTTTKIYVKQWIYFLILTRLYGQNLGVIYSLLFSNRAQILKDYIVSLFGELSSRSWAYKHADSLLCKHLIKLNLLFSAFQDFYFGEIGEAIRKACKTVFNGRIQDITVPIESFIGLTPPSKIFPKFDPYTRGELMPYFYSRIYQTIKHISSTTELDGALKEVISVDKQLVFHLAGRLGFINRPPGIHKLYRCLSYIENQLASYEKIIDKSLVVEEVQDLSVSTVDGSNIPVDQRDNSASNGSGSRGAFFGHKASIGCGTNCIPITSTTESGRAADSTLFSNTLAPMTDLAKESNVEILAICTDAGYSSTNVINEIEANGAIPFVDINPRGSQLLQELKDTCNTLQKLSKKAIRQGLAEEERKKWIDDVKIELKQCSGSIIYDIKLKAVKSSLFNWANFARYHGLTLKEQQMEWRLRKKISVIRQRIRKSGTPAEKTIGDSEIIQGTIEWFLVYHIRGQNEGINGILKKRGDIIGDGQHTSWKTGLKSIRNRIKSEIVMIKTAALVCKRITSNLRHGMRFIYNWRSLRSFLFTIFRRFCRRIPTQS